MKFDRVAGDSELGGELFVAYAGGEEAEDLEFAWGEGLDCGVFAGCAISMGKAGFRLLMGEDDQVVGGGRDGGGNRGGRRMRREAGVNGFADIWLGRKVVCKSDDWRSPLREAGGTEPGSDDNIHGAGLAGEGAGLHDVEAFVFAENTRNGLGAEQRIGEYEDADHVGTSFSCWAARKW